MKLITLNIWGGRVHKPFLNFLKKHKEIDVFCLQEVYHNAKGKEIIYTDAMLNIYEDIKKVLPNYNGYYRPHLQDYYGLALFIKKNISLTEEGECFVHRQKGYIPNDNVGFHAKNVQYVTIPLNQKIITLLNFHGLWNGKGKNDTEERIKQSKNIIEFAKKLKNDFIICGDFNLLPETESLKLIEHELGLRNLISEYGITSTRTLYYNKENKFADYVFTTPGIIIKDFKVLPDEVSDHNPLYLEFE